MPDRSDRSPLRLLAPVALVLFSLAFLAVVLSSGLGEEEASRDRAAERRTTTTTTTERRRTRRSSYTVRTGDTLATIAEKTGVPVERIQELNPNLDPQALVSGQRIKLR